MIRIEGGLADRFGVDVTGMLAPPRVVFAVTGWKELMGKLCWSACLHVNGVKPDEPCEVYVYNRQDRVYRLAGAE